MLNCRLRIVAFARTWLPVLLGLAAVPAALSAQTEVEGHWTAVPLLGFGVVRDGGWGSGGMEAALELGYERAGWGWSGYGSLRGLGVGCSHACFDGGPALAMGVSRSVGAIWIGGGMGAMRQFGEWHALPYGRVSLDAAPLRLDLRVEFPRRSGPGVYMPILVGIPVSR
jgi:hypothetical protein